MTTTVEMTYREAVGEALREALRADDRVVLLGSQVDRHGPRAAGQDLLEEFGPDRVRDTPLSAAAFIGIGVGAALQGLRPVVEVTASDAGLRALALLMSGAASLLHRSGGQFAVPLVVRMTCGDPRLPSAARSISPAGWYAHFPGLRILTPATLEDARGMLATALEDPDPVLIFEHCALDNLRGTLALDAGAVDIDRAAVRRSGADVTLVTYGGMLTRTLESAEVLAAAGVSAEVVDLRTLRPLDEDTVVESVRRTRRAVVVDEEWRSGSLAAEVVSRVQERTFHDLLAPVERVCSAEVPLPYALELEQAALPQVETIVAAARRTGVGPAGTRVRPARRLVAGTSLAPETTVAVDRTTDPARADRGSRPGHETSHFRLARHIDMTAALAWVEARNRALPAGRRRLVPAALVLHAIARAAGATPSLNGCWADEAFQPGDAVHLGVAIALGDGGFVAPAILDADGLSIEETMDRLADLVLRARREGLTSRELTAATITVTDLGDQGVETVYGVIIAPQVALVGVGRIVERPWAVDGMLGVRPVITVTLSADHRATDGFAGARFLAVVDHHLQHPEDPGPQVPGA